MTQPLNYTPKAIEALSSYDMPQAPLSAAGVRWIVGKLREAQVFVLHDHGQLLDRSRPRPEVPGLIFKPPFPVVALEYTAVTQRCEDSMYTNAPCSRRIALAWEADNSMPAVMTRLAPPLEPGVIVASISWYDEHQMWMPVFGAIHIPYAGDWQQAPDTEFRNEMVRVGRIRPDQARRSFTSTPVPILPEAMLDTAKRLGGPDAMLNVLSADMMDEVNAYTDLCYALACKNVTTSEHPAPANLNRQRIKNGKLPLKGFHVLELTGGGDDMPGAGATIGDRSGPRSHLRRGHIRRLSGNRVTWVNSTVVRGRGFVDKVYAA